MIKNYRLNHNVTENAISVKYYSIIPEMNGVIISSRSAV